MISFSQDLDEYDWLPTLIHMHSHVPPNGAINIKSACCDPSCASVAKCDSLAESCQKEKEIYWLSTLTTWHHHIWIQLYTFLLVEAIVKETWVLISIFALNSYSAICIYPLPWKVKGLFPFLRCSEFQWKQNDSSHAIDVATSSDRKTTLPMS